MKTTTSAGGTSNTMADIDAAASLAQVPGIYKPSAKNDILAGMDVDQNHGGMNDIIHPTDGAASSTTMTVYNCSAPTAEDLGIS